MSPPSSKKKQNAEEGDNDDGDIPMSSLARSNRRNSISMPGLDLLVKLAEYSWRLVIQGAANVHGAAAAPNASASTAPSSSAPFKQSKPPINSSFDDLVEAGHADAASPKVSRTNLEGNVAVVPARRRAGFQPNLPGRHPGPPGFNRTGLLENDDEEENPENDESDGSEVSEPELVTPLSKKVSMNPSPGSKKRSNGRANGGRRVGLRTPSLSDDEDDDVSTAMKPLAARRKGSVAPIRISNSNFNHSSGPTSNGHGMKHHGGGDEEKGASSPTPSMTSLSSLLREKLGQLPIPGIFRNKKPREYKLQAFVSILFLTIIVIVGSIYIIHKEKELQKSYFDRIRFSSKDRRIRITNVQDRIVLSGRLGVKLNTKDKPWPCLAEHQRENETCLEWMDKGRLYLKTKAPPPKGVLPVGSSSSLSSSGSNILCYGIYWEALSSDFPLMDCYDMGDNNRFFYGGGETARDQWTLNKTTVPYMPFLTGKKVEEDGAFQWGRSLRRYFVNSEGAAIKVTDTTPLYISINHPERKQICFGGVYDGFGYPSVEDVGRLAFLNYTICTAENVLEISRRLADKDIWERLRHEDAQLSYFLSANPIWRLRPEILDVGNQSDVALLNHTDKIAEIQSEGFILLDERWQKRIGDLESDSERFPNLAETFNITKRRGFKIALTVQPFFSTQSKNYVEGLEKGVWLAERPRDTPFGRLTSQDIPALTKYKEWNSVAVLDVTKEKARSWFHNKTWEMAVKYGIEALYADMGTVFDLPQYYEFFQPLASADEAKDLFLQTLRKIPYISTIGVSTAAKLPKPPTFVALSPTESSWEGLRTVIPNMLSLGLAGFPFLIPGSIGGDYFKEDNKINEILSPPENLTLSNETPLTTAPPAKVNISSGETEISKESISNTNTDGNSVQGSSEATSPLSSQTKTSSSSSSSSIQLPDRDLYIRWLQLSHFLPVVQYSFLPNDYDEEVLKIAKDLGKERSQKIQNYIKKAMDDALTTGMPIIRPLWMVDPLDSNCLRVSDEFVIGDDIIVAPILHAGATERDIYLPRGIWKDELERSSTKGERWLHNYKVKQNQIPYFIKLPDTGQILSK